MGRKAGATGAAIILAAGTFVSGCAAQSGAWGPESPGGATMAAAPLPPAQRAVFARHPPMGPVYETGDSPAPVLSTRGEKWLSAPAGAGGGRAAMSAPPPPVFAGAPAPGGGPAFFVGDQYVRAQPLSYQALQGWGQDDQTEALVALGQVCAKAMQLEPSLSMGGPALQGQSLAGTAGDWGQICAAWSDAPRHPQAARAFFEAWFQPVMLAMAPDEQALFTGYYEPELRGSRQRVGPFQFPIYSRPSDLMDGSPYLTRAQIDAGGLQGRGLEMVYVDDPVDLFFLHIQGSGRVRLQDGGMIRVGFAGKNGRSYKSIGATLANWGEMTLDQASADSIKAWARANPQRMWALFAENPSYIFFEEKTSLAPAEGPIGSFGTPLPSLRAVAVDPKVYGLGLPVWIETDSPAGPLHRLMLALDTGGAIKGAQRADIFFGSGDEAGRLAGGTKNYGRMIALAPRAALMRILSGRGIRA